MLELACKDLVFHFNKKHLEDSSIPMWVIKTSGKTYYVNHVSSSMNWTTKETETNPHTKGSIKFKDCYCLIDNENNAEIRKLTEVDKARIKAKNLGHTRIIFNDRNYVLRWFKNHKIKFTPTKYVPGSCGSGFYICDIIKPEHATFVLLAMPKNYIRVLCENEIYWKAYDDKKLLESLDADNDYTKND